LKQAARDWGVTPDEVKKYLSPEGGEAWLESHAAAQRSSERREKGNLKK
jgi:hypothetical protein